MILAVSIGIMLLFYIWNGRRSFSDLAVQDSLTLEPPFFVADLPGKGKGLLASRDIQVFYAWVVDVRSTKCTHSKASDCYARNHCLLSLTRVSLLSNLTIKLMMFAVSSSPSALIAGSLAKLSRNEQEAFFNLSYVNFPQHLDPDEDLNEVRLAIFQTNAVACGDGVGIFPTMARINHGCSSAFNAVYTWREKERTLYVHALKAIGRGEVRFLISLY